MIKTLIKHLKKNKDYYYSWQANIAMAFRDEYDKQKRIKKNLNSSDIHEIANNGAKNFLNLLINMSK